MDVWVARQPICDPARRIVAYELLHRMRQGCAGRGASASADVLIHSLFTIGLEQLSGGRKVFVNLPPELLCDDRLHLFPPDRIGFEILEETQPSSDVLAACNRLRESGFQLLLDDFSGQPELLPFLDVVDAVKVEWLSGWRASEQLLFEWRSRRRAQLLAEKVETEEGFREARELGFDLFQGYFFERPETYRGRRLPANAASRARLMGLLTDSEASVERMCEAVVRDPELSVLLLKWVNSARSERRSKVNSVQRALQWLGEGESRRWLTVLLLPALAPGLDRAVLHALLARARLAENLATGSPKEVGRVAFLASLMAGLARLFGMAAPEIGKQFRLSTGLERLVTLVLDRSPADAISACILAAETYCDGRWDDMAAIVSTPGLEGRRIMEYYVEAQAWPLQI